MLVKIVQRQPDVQFKYQMNRKRNPLYRSYLSMNSFLENANLASEKHVYEIAMCITHDIKQILYSSPLIIENTYLISDGLGQVCGHITVEKRSFILTVLCFKIMIYGKAYNIYELGKGKMSWLTLYQDKGV